MIASAGAVKAGQDIVINTNNAEWANAITEVFVNSKAYDADKYVTVTGTQIIIASELMDSEGSYTVKFAAEGYADVKAIAQNVLEASGNVIVNGKFATNLDGWETYFSSWNIPNGSAEVVDGEAVIHVVSTEGNNWDVQLKQAGLELNAASYYMLSFDAYVTVPRPIQMEFANLGTASQTIVNLGTEKQTHYIYFTNVAATEAASVLFMGGNVNGCLGDFAAVGPHDIVIDNVALYEASLEEIQAVIAPNVSLKEQVVFGNDIVLAYEENTVWESKAISVTVDGKAIADSNASLLPETWATWIGEGDQGTFVELLADEFTFDFVETNLGQQKISVPAGESHFAIEYTPGARSDFYVLLMVGGCEKGIAPHNITLSNITLTEKAAGGVVEKEPVEAPAADTVKAETAEGGKVTLSWNAVEGVNTYGIYAAEEADGNYVLVAETSETSYVLENLTAGTYYYAVAALATDDAHCASALVKMTVVVEGEEEPEQPVNPDASDKDDTNKEDTNKNDTDKGNTGSGNTNSGSSNSGSSSNVPQISVITPQASATQSQSSQVTVADGFTLPEVTEETVEEKEEVVEEAVQEEKTETEDVKTEEIADEEVPLAAPAVEENGMSVNVLAAAIVVVLFCIGATALGLVFRKKDELE